MFCACEIVYLFSAVCAVITDVHKFDRKLDMNETHPENDQWTEGYAMIQTHVFGRICTFS